MDIYGYMEIPSCKCICSNQNDLITLKIPYILRYKQEHLSAGFIKTCQNNDFGECLRQPAASERQS